jgi:hypothetical protein
MRTLLSIPMVLLPPRYRGRAQGADLEGAAVAAGAVQALGCVSALIVLYIVYFDARMQEVAGAFLEGGVEGALGGRGVQAGMGTVVTLEYIFRPQSLALIYFTAEGVVRVAAALASSEIIGTLPLYLVGWTHAWLEKKKEDLAKPALVMDEVERVTGAAHTLRIASCRPKPHWDHLMTVSYEEELFEIMAEKKGRPERPFVYFLRPKPEGKVVRGLHHYQPEEGLREEE